MRVHIFLLLSFRVLSSYVIDTCKHCNSKVEASFLVQKETEERELVTQKMVWYLRGVKVTNLE
jgi:hypothetical protein